jgi:hypothetical protein
LLLKLRLLVFRVKIPSQAEDDDRSLLVAVSGVWPIHENIRHSHVGGNLNALLLKLRLLVFRVKIPSQAEDDDRSLLVAVSGVWPIHENIRHSMNLGIFIHRC